jgi:hypothetical protein
MSFADVTATGGERTELSATSDSPLFRRNAAPARHLQLAEFSAKHPRALWTEMRDDRIRDVSSPSNSKGEGADHDPRIEFDDLRKLSRLGENAQLATVERWAETCGRSLSVRRARRYVDDAGRHECSGRCGPEPETEGYGVERVV